ncbi:MAG TPA: chemotaxis protein CheA, partial [Chloroflexota bacterium]|nr:chemotaxis protein CheA [Chloroflexota bacterium]
PNGSPAATTAKSASSLGKTVRIDVSRLDNLVNLVGELVIDQTRLTRLGTMLQGKYDDDSVSDLSETSQHIGRIVDELQESIMKARMLPVESLFNRFPRVVRDLAQRSGKKIDFVVEGRETELDRSVIEELHDPLVHLLRNCVDHGVEPPEKRVAAGKPEVGQIRLSAMHRENRILIRVQDDGAGMDAAKIKATAIKRGVLTAEAAERLSDQEAVELVFMPGFSTAEKITDVSGRGVGMDIVRTNIEKLNGSVTIDTHIGQGTCFTLELPLTLAIIDALMVGVGDQIFAIPLVSVMETLRVWRSEIQSINSRQAIQLRETVLPLITLEKALALPSSQESVDRVFVVAVRVGDNRFGLVVDSLLGELQVVIKSLGRQVGTIAGVTGATILGDGRVALILDVPSLVKCVLDEQSKGWAA